MDTDLSSFARCHAASPACRRHRAREGAAARAQSRAQEQGPVPAPPEAGPQVAQQPSRWSGTWLPATSLLGRCRRSAAAETPAPSRLPPQTPARVSAAMQAASKARRLRRQHSRLSTVLWADRLWRHSVAPPAHCSPPPANPACSAGARPLTPAAPCPGRAGCLCARQNPPRHPIRTACTCTDFSALRPWLQPGKPLLTISPDRMHLLRSHSCRFAYPSLLADPVHLMNL